MPSRDRLTAALRDLRESADRSTYQVVHAVTAQGPRIRVVVTVSVAEGQEDAYERAYAKVAERMRGTRGHVREELLRESGTSTYHLFAEWENEKAFHAWADDPSHMDQTAPLLPYLLESFERKIHQIVVRPEAARGPGGARGARGDHGGRRSSPRWTPGRTDVLIVGAGPTGLTAAIELARRGVACRIIDRRAEPSSAADKAIGIQCRTMEIWENIGVVAEAMDAGSWLHGQTVFVNGRQTHQVSWDLPELPYAHLGLPQYETERILTGCLARLGVAVERGTELLGFAQDDDGVTARLRLRLRRGTDRPGPLPGRLRRRAQRRAGEPSGRPSRAAWACSRSCSCSATSTSTGRCPPATSCGSSRSRTRR